MAGGADPALRVRERRNLLAHAPDRLHEEVSAATRHDLRETAKEIEERRKAFLRKWRLKCRAVADSLEEAGDRLFTFTRLPPGQWALARTTMPSNGCTRSSNAGIKTQTVLPSPETAAMLFLGAARLRTNARCTGEVERLAETLATKPTDAVIDVAAPEPLTSSHRICHTAFPPHSRQHETVFSKSTLVSVLYHRAPPSFRLARSALILSRWSIVSAIISTIRGKSALPDQRPRKNTSSGTCFKNPRRKGSTLLSQCASAHSRDAISW